MVDDEEWNRIYELAKDPRVRNLIKRNDFWTKTNLSWEDIFEKFEISEEKLMSHNFFNLYIENNKEWKVTKKRKPTGGESTEKKKGKHEGGKIVN